MHPLPHKYVVKASSKAEGDVVTSRTGLTPIHVSPPVEFGGPGNHWSPEELLSASIADCFILSFRAIAKAMSLPWQTLSCQVTATLDKVDRQMQFTHFLLEATLEINNKEAAEQAQSVLEKAEETCLVSNSLKAPCELACRIKLV